ncbi:MAG: 16S rRNA (cytidine(1402)-2'-O)-methyltransferase [Pseudomonadota bacterium]
MKIEPIILDPGLYFVATPIGSARDITLRALDILASAEVLVAEDTRTLRKLMQIHGVPLGEREVLAYHDHNGAKVRPRLVSLLQAGKSMAYASEAGTPLVADPGYQLARAAIDAGVSVTSAPGPSAVIAAISIAGLPTDRFMFVGFPPTARGHRVKWLKTALAVDATLVFYETAKRLPRVLADIAEVADGARQVAICRELTKRFEDVQRGTLAELLSGLSDMTLKGEIVVLVDRDRSSPSEAGLEEILLTALKEMSVKDAVAEAVQRTGLPRRQVYQTALKLEGKE